MITENDLEQFTGTTQYYENTFGLRFTDGVKYLADTAGAYWLIDLVESWQTKHIVKVAPFQVWRLQVDLEKHRAVAECWTDTPDDENSQLIAQQKIPYTDFPLAEIELFCIDGVLLLKSEY